MSAKEFRNVLLFICNRWSEEECKFIYGYLGPHIWNKWIEGCENHHGSLDCIAWFILELDNECLQKLINRSSEYYNK